MKRLPIALICTVVTSFVHGQEVALNSIRIAAEDTPALAAFYQAAFGMHEINRLELAQGPEVFLNFGEDVAAARANPGARIVIMPRQSDDFEDPIAHVIFTVSDIYATVDAVKAAGGSMQREATPYGDTGIVIGFAVDPVGNLVELIQTRQ